MLLDGLDELEKMYAGIRQIYDGMVEKTFKQIGDYQFRAEEAETERDRNKSRINEYAAALMSAKKKIAALERAISKGCRTCVKNIKNKQCDGEKCRYYDYKWWQFDEARFANGGEVNG